MKILGYEIYTDGLENLDFSKKMVINTLNPHSYITAKSDPLFREALHGSDHIIPDGEGIVLAAKHLNNKTIKKVAGADLHQFLLNKMDKEHGKVFYMGASQSTLDKIEAKIANEYKNIKVASYSPPYKPEFSDEDNNKIISKVNEFKPDVLFIGMTAPKQEKWLHQHKDRLDFKVAGSIGAVFDFFAGTVERPSQVWIDLRLEWFVRWIKEPRRLFKRTFVSVPYFLLDVLKHKLFSK